MMDQRNKNKKCGWETMELGVRSRGARHIRSPTDPSYAAAYTSKSLGLRAIGEMLAETDPADFWYAG